MQSNRKLIMNMIYYLWLLLLIIHNLSSSIPTPLDTAESEASNHSFTEENEVYSFEDFDSGEQGDVQCYDVDILSFVYYTMTS